MLALERAGDVGLLGGADDVDQRLELLAGQAVLGGLGVLDQVQTRPAPTSGSRVRPAGDHREQAEPAERSGVEQPTTDRGVVDPGREQAGRQLVGVGPGVAEPEGAGVGRQPRIQAGGELRVEGHAEIVEEFGDQGHGRRSRAGSIRRTSPKPGLLAWWSTTTEVPAASSSARQLAEPARSRRRRG